MKNEDVIEELAKAVCAERESDLSPRLRVPWEGQFAEAKALRRGEVRALLARLAELADNDLPIDAYVAGWEARHRYCLDKMPGDVLTAMLKNLISSSEGGGE